MKIHLRRRIFSFALSALLGAAMTPYALHSQDTQSRSASPTTKTKKSRKSKKDSEPGGATLAARSTPEQSPQSNSRSHSEEHRSVPARTPPTPGMVWVNTNSKVYHKAGSRWYGKTKEGKWMTESNARKAGYKAAKN